MSILFDLDPLPPAPPKRHCVHFTVELLNAIAVKFDLVFEGDDPNECAVKKWCEGSYRTGVTDGNTWWPVHQIQHITWTTEEITNAQTD